MILILVRVDKIKVGDVKIPGYASWFVASSIEFGSGQKAEAKDKNARDIETLELEEQELQLDKSIDSATVYLMYYAMKSRAETGTPQVLSIDIHLKQDTQEGSNDEQQGVFLKIRIENAIIRSWNISVNEDGRPTESLTIWFNKAAMKYRSFDGKNFIEYGPTGWDQQDNKDWKSDVL